MSISIAPIAADDIGDVVVFGLRHFGEKQTRSYLDALLEMLNWLGTSPMSGQVRIRREGRTIMTRVHRVHVIIYSVHDDGRVVVERIQSTRADWARLLDY